MLGLIVTCTLATAATILYGLVARAVLDVADDRRVGALLAYGLGWGGLAGMIGSDAAKFLLGFMAEPSASVYEAFVWLKISANGLMLGGFASYIAFLATGAKRALWVGVVLGLVHAGFWLVNTNGGLPGTVVVGEWATRMEFHGDGAVGIPPPLGLVMFFLPATGCALAYLWVGRSVDSKAQRIRHRMVVASLLVFLGAATVQGSPDVSPDSLVLPLGMAVALLTGLASYFSFKPTPWMRQRWGLEPFGS